MTQHLRATNGFTLIDLILAVALIGILAAITVPVMQNVTDSIALGQGQQMVESELQQARLKAVTVNRPIRVRFNCPVAGQFRMLELIGTPSVPAVQDGAANRCSEITYPYPSSDRNPVTLPNHDGPIRRLPQKVSFGATPVIEFRPTGTAHMVNANGTSGAPLAGAGTAITVTRGAVVKTVTVNGLGRVQGQ